MVGGALLGLLIVTPVLYSAIDRRTVEQREGSTEAREGMKAAARLIISDFPLGIGANRYVVVANVGGYSERGGLLWDAGSRGAPVHNSYYFVTAEMGWLGLAGSSHSLSRDFCRRFGPRDDCLKFRGGNCCGNRCQLPNGCYSCLL